jgi:hypothetical protein
MDLEPGEIHLSKLTSNRSEVHLKDHEEIHLSFHTAACSDERFASPPAILKLFQNLLWLLHSKELYPFRQGFLIHKQPIRSPDIPSTLPLQPPANHSSSHDELQFCSCVSVERDHPRPHPARQPLPEDI